MSLNPTKESELCSDKNQTSVIVHTGSFIYSSSYNFKCKASQTISLLQEPDESALLEFSLSYRRNEDRYNYNHTYTLRYNFELTFENNLHHVSNDYEYKIDFYVYVYDSDMTSHTLLFSRKEMRKTNKISISESFKKIISHSDPSVVRKLRMSTSKRHLCCNIRRYNTKVPEKVLTENAHIGKMLMETGRYSDVTLVVGEKLFPAHRHVLSEASSIFKAMFSHDMKEDQQGKVIIEDFEPEVIEGLLSFIYTGKTSMISKMPIELFKLADKYEIQALKDECIEHFFFTLNCGNVVKMLYAVNIYELTKLRSDLLKFIETHEDAMVKEGSFHDYLCDNLKIDTVVYTLKLCDKYEILLKDVETETFNFIKKNNSAVVQHEEFLKLFDTHSSLMKRLYIFIAQN